MDKKDCLFEIADQLPEQLPLPPNEWATPFSLLSKECDIQTDILVAFTQVETLYQKILPIISEKTYSH